MVLIISDMTFALKGQVKLPRNMNNGDRVEIHGRDYVVMKTTINFLLMVLIFKVKEIIVNTKIFSQSGGYKRKHFLLVEPAHSYILNLAAGSGGY